MNRGSFHSLAVALGASLALSAPVFAQAGANDGRTRTPIKHVIIIIGENRSFDHSFGTFVPKKGQLISNLRDLAAQTLDEVRKLALELRPSVLDDLGLVAALRQYVRATEERSGLAAQLTVVGWDESEDARLPAEVRGL